MTTEKDGRAIGRLDGAVEVGQEKGMAGVLEQVA
jgi:hypothetical protein